MDGFAPQGVELLTAWGADDLLIGGGRLRSEWHAAADDQLLVAADGFAAAWMETGVRVRMAKCVLLLMKPNSIHLPDLMEGCRLYTQLHSSCSFLCQVLLSDWLTDHIPDQSNIHGEGWEGGCVNMDSSTQISNIAEIHITKS